MIRPLLFTSLAVLIHVSTSTVASAGVCDLTTNGATCGPSVFTNFAIFGEVSPQPTGTGYIDPFLRLQNNGQDRAQQGYNTSAQAPFQLDQKEPAQLHARSPVVGGAGQDHQRSAIQGVLPRYQRVQIGQKPSFVARRAPYLSVPDRQCSIRTIRSTRN